MAKSKKSTPLKKEDLRELIVVMSSDTSTTISKGKGSSPAENVASLNNLMKSYDFKLVPLFGTEERIASASSKAKTPSPEIVSELATYYIVETESNKDELLKELRKLSNVTGAYLKPIPEPPVAPEPGIKNKPEMMASITPAATPNYISRQLYLNAAPGGINALYAHLCPGGKGDGIKIIDIEGAWRFTHEDLLTNQGGVIGGTQSSDLGWRNHGTAVAGEFSGDENGVGIIGICPKANVRAVSIFGGLGTANAIRTAANALSTGDIILIELHAPGPRHNFTSRADQAGYIAMEWWPDNLAAIQYATSRGVIVVEAGGNGAENLDDAIYNTRPSGFPSTWRNPFNLSNPQSGAIVVGAGAPPPGTHGRNHGPDRSRLSFSNYGRRVDVQGWGREVTTTGYGDLQGGPNEDYWYTDTFSGTSSASPIVVGALGCIQGRLKNRSRPLLTPSTAKNLLRTTGSPQQDAPGRPATQRIGNRPDLKQIFTSLSVGKGLLADKVVKEKEFAKEQLKDQIKDVKEFAKENKDNIKEFKEIKEHDKNFIKDKDKEIRETDFRFQNDLVHPDQRDLSESEDRLTRVEEAVQALQHFISTELRPDLLDPLVNQE